MVTYLQSMREIPRVCGKLIWRYWWNLPRVGWHILGSWVEFTGGGRKGEGYFKYNEQYRWLNAWKCENMCRWKTVHSYGGVFGECWQEVRLKESPGPGRIGTLPQKNILLSQDKKGESFAKRIGIYLIY